MMTIPKGFSEFNMGNISVEFYNKIQPTPSECGDGLNE